MGTKIDIRRCKKHWTKKRLKKLSETDFVAAHDIRMLIGYVDELNK